MKARRRVWADFPDCSSAPARPMIGTLSELSLDLPCESLVEFLAVQGTRKSLLQHHSSKASIPQRSAFFIVQLSHPYMTTGKTRALTIWTFVGKAMSLLFNMLSTVVITFLPRRKCLFMAAVTICSDFGAPKNKVSHCSHCFPICLPFEWDQMP